MYVSISQIRIIAGSLYPNFTPNAVQRDNAFVAFGIQ